MYNKNIIKNAKTLKIKENYARISISEKVQA